MIQSMEFTPATIVIVLLVLLWAIWAVRRLLHRGMCDCNDRCDGCSKGAGSSTCSSARASADSCCGGCKAAEGMVANIENALK